MGSYSVSFAREKNDERGDVYIQLQRERIGRNLVWLESVGGTNTRPSKKKKTHRVCVCVCSLETVIVNQVAVATVSVRSIHTV